MEQLIGQIRPIRFYCKKCGKEMWKGFNYELSSNRTIKELIDVCICIKCHLKEIHKEK